jgi:uncharacterized membrane protein YphA (DoxX/SURF4 family)
MLFRPLIGWATAWSFDRLRLWIDRGIDPAVSAQRSMIHAIARLCIAFVFLYHGLVPKLLYRHPSELTMLLDAGFDTSMAQTAVTVAGIGEIVFAAIILAAWRSRWPFFATVILMGAALAGVAFTSRAMLVAAFNPVTLNLCMIALAAIGWTASRELPSASRCLRERPLGEA